MNLEDRTAAFENLGNYIHAIDEVEFREIAEKAKNENSWFTEESIREAFNGIANYLTRQSLTEWLSNYSFKSAKPKVIAVVMAGNIPLVGFHDFLSVLISGNHIQVKLSSKDTSLFTFLQNKLIEIEPRFSDAIQVVSQLKNFDAVIATGSDNSARYFDYYFSKYPNLIRKNRSSVAILTGFESDDELFRLGKDVFTYFGLGCRNVSKIYVPDLYDFGKLFRAWEPYQNVLLNHKYHNNYDYQKSILLINRVNFLDSGFIMITQNERLVSPISVIYYEYYETWDALLIKLSSAGEKIQCIVGNAKPATVEIGQAQSPKVWDYADKVDTLKFLENLN